MPSFPLTFDNSFFRLGDLFYSKVSPKGFENPHLVSVNPDAAQLIGLDSSVFQQPEFLTWASGNQTLENSAPLAMVYSGHQFGNYVPQLGDGRGLLLGEAIGPKGKWDIHLKGAGHTPYSRFGDGRAVLRSTLREYLGSEALHGLGIPTTRALCVVGSDEPVQRETVETGAMFIRLARSHIRFGSFEYFYYTNQPEAVKTLADYVIKQYYPELADKKERYEDMFRHVVHNTAHTIAQWQAVGFCHGVMNSDNMSILGDTLDYGPYGFLDSYNPSHICNHSDHNGRYAYNQQPMIGLWNCNALANALMSLLSVEQLTYTLEEYEPLFIETLIDLRRKKLGLLIPAPNDQQLIDNLLKLMADNQVDYTLFFRQLCDFDETENSSPLRDHFRNPKDFDQWANDYSQRLQQEKYTPTERQLAMKQVNPKFVLRNYMAETAILKAEDEYDYSEIDRLLALLSTPFDEHPDCEEYAGHPPDWAQKINVSCSS